MKVLTFGPSPYLANRLGSMHAELIKHFSDVSSIVSNHDREYFMVDEVDHKYWYQIEEEKICEVFPFNPKSTKALDRLQNIVDKQKPDLIITIGDYYDTHVMSFVKKVCPGFKWVAILANGSNLVQDSYIEYLQDIDFAILTNPESVDEFKNVCSVPSEFILYNYVDSSMFYPRYEEDEYEIIICARNTENSNLLAVIAAMSEIDMSCYLHTNIHDDGYYDVEGLIRKFNANHIRIPGKFSSEVESGKNLLGFHHSISSVFLDVSTQSATGGGLLEAMASGCVPLVTDVGAMGHIVGSNFPTVHSTLWQDGRGDIVKIADISSLQEIALKYYDLWESHQKDFNELRLKSISIAESWNYSFVQKIENIAVKTMSKTQPMLVVDFLNEK